MNGPNPNDLFLAMDVDTKQAVERRIQYLKDKIASLKVCINDYTVNVEKRITEFVTAPPGPAGTIIDKGLIRAQVKEWREERMRVLKEVICLSAAIHQKP